MRFRTMLSTCVLGASCLVGGCSAATTATTAPSPPASAICDAKPAQFAIGERAGAALLERARVAAAARSARFLRPKDAITMEYSDSRLNLNLDEQDVVRTVTCG